MNTFLTLIVVNALLIALASLIVSIVRLVQKRNAKVSGIVSVIGFVVCFTMGVIAAGFYSREPVEPVVKSCNDRVSKPEKKGSGNSISQ